MSDLDDIMGDISRGDQRDARFELSTVKHLLANLGMPRTQITALERDKGDGLDWAWFNNQAHLQLHCGSGRDFRFSFEDFFFRPTRHEIVQAAFDWRDQEGCDPKDPWLFIFNVYDHGRMAATNLTLKHLTHIHVSIEAGDINIAPLKQILLPFANSLSPA